MSKSFQNGLRIAFIAMILIVISAGIYLTKKNNIAKEHLRVQDSIYKVDSTAYEHRKDSINKEFDRVLPIAQQRIKVLIWKERKLDSIIKANPKILTR